MVIDPLSAYERHRRTDDERKAIIGDGARERTRHRTLLATRTTTRKASVLRRLFPEKRSATYIRVIV